MFKILNYPHDDESETLDEDSRIVVIDPDKLWDLWIDEGGEG